ncbi:MAG: TIR domain-containing protein [Chloroflexi bacterium]|nr:TIR domain-containing protein [Chloroflexota bacterium]
MSHVFISYSRKDEAFARQLVADMQAAGLDVWFDRTSIQPGENWDKAIEEGLVAAVAVVIILSPDSMASDNVRNEINFARDNDQLLLPVLHRPTRIILNLETINWIDVSTAELYQANLKTLVGRIQLELETMKTQTPPPEASQFSGVAVESQQDNLTVASDSRQVSPTQLRRYLRTLAVIAAPFAEAGPSKASYIDLSLAWRNLASAIAQIPLETGSTPLALVRLSPPTPTMLERAVNDYQILHLVAHSDGDVLYLEDEQSVEATLTPARVDDIFENSSIELVVVHNPLGEGLVRSLLNHVKAVIHAPKHPGDDITTLFDTRFYNRLTAGESIKSAYDSVVNDLPGDVSYHLHFADELSDHTLAKPDNPAIKSLIDPSLPPMRNVPVNLGFVGQTASLREINEAMNETNARQLALYGLGGIGKSWLASEFVARYAWRFPDGILWMHISEQTKSEDVIGQLLALLELPARTSPGDLRTILRNRRVLVVLDQANEWSDPLEVGELADFISRLDTLGGTRFMVTAWSAVEPLTHTSGTREYTLGELPQADAAELLRRLIRAHDLEKEFNGVEKVRSFLTKTHHTPWLIREGIELVKLDGLEATLEDLENLPEEVFDRLDFYVGRQVEQLDAPAISFLKKLQGLPDSFDRTLARALDDTSRQHMRDLLRRHLLRRDGTLYNLPATVRAYLRQNHPLTDEEQDRVDEVVIQHLMGASV